MTYLELIERVSIHTQLTKKASRELLDTVALIIIQAVKADGRFWWPGLGAWQKRTRKPRTIRNPVTRELMRLPRTHSLGFRGTKGAL